VNHTSREGGETLRRAASRIAQKHLPGSGWCFFDVRHEFPDAWELLHDSCEDDDAKAMLALRLERRMFPYVPLAGELSITGMAVLFQTDSDDECDRRGAKDCPCPQEGEAARHIVGFKHQRRDCDDDEVEISCFACEDSPDLYYGVFDTQIGPFEGDRERAEIQFRFPKDTGAIERVYLLCRYERQGRECQPSEPCRDSRFA